MRMKKKIRRVAHVEIRKRVRGLICGEMRTKCATVRTEMRK